ncbi:MAG: 2-keto-4-pentenoate hydratase, partial [Flavobacteriaceae bacterium]|nr:2-keto-4-pentenoate hydratase [Flavobacteriaceae bacterium]
MIQEAIQKASQQLHQAELTKKTCSPVREIIGSEDIDSAYEIQSHNIQQKIANGATVKGYKIGLTSEAVQKQLGVDQPDFGVLLNTMEITTKEFSFSALMQPKAEAEIAFFLKEDIIDPTLDLNKLKAAIDYAVASVEIVGSR